MKYRVDNEEKTANLAARVGALLLSGDVVALVGDLGAGKTAFARALINSLLDTPEEVPSPTFTLVQTYPAPQFDIWHFDLYRLKEERSDILELGWDDARRDGVVLAEWPDRLGGLLPKNRLEISIAFTKDSVAARDITLTPFGTWDTRLKGFDEHST